MLKINETRIKNLCVKKCMLRIYVNKLTINRHESANSKQMNVFMSIELKGKKLSMGKKKK